MSCDQFNFDIKKYTGLWYELIHYPSWFQGANTYNTTAYYELVDNQIHVHNSTIVNGQYFDSYGTAQIVTGGQLRVDFPMSEVNKLVSSKQFALDDTSQQYMVNKNEPNYVIDYIWTNAKEEYMFSIVTDLHKESLYVLSRLRHPSLEVFNKVMSYVSEHYDVKKLVQTPHYD